MHIKKFFTPERTRLSFEIFPPNQRMFLKAVMASAARMAAYDPDFMSVTFKADGSGGDQTMRISNAVSEVMGIPSIANLPAREYRKRSLMPFTTSLWKTTSIIFWSWAATLSGN